MPSASFSVSTSTPKRFDRAASTPSLCSRPRQKSSEPSGMVKPTVVTWPLPRLRAGHVGQPKNVIAVPGDPTWSPK